MTISVEFFPPKDQAGEDRLWDAMAALHNLSPDFISVTYGAGGSTRDRTIRITKEITEKTGINTVAHLTCVGSTKAELVEILGQYKSVGIKSILALRGDPTNGPAAPWSKTPHGFDHADQLVELAALTGGFEIGVAAFPDGHPASGGDLNKDIDVLIRKEELGATFATTQFFFESSKWISLVEKLQNRGSKMPVFAGILPITNVKQLKRMSELGGARIPPKIEQAFTSIAENEDSVQKLGIEIATTLCDELLQAGVPGLHFYTMNSAKATLEIAANLGLSENES
ncbi:MAG: methylenetetrahydrofolate reductase [NAD(P)H] [Actinobacteria bacterium]|jgi:methylenetetrahydrofolate reductase (NADPH)|nr:methylenetetrahydrofolate reductase [NAD(P)H] [Actinomycetota bacterium]